MISSEYAKKESDLTVKERELSDKKRRDEDELAQKRSMMTAE